MESLQYVHTPPLVSIEIIGRVHSEGSSVVYMCLLLIIIVEWDVPLNHPNYTNR